MNTKNTGGQWRAILALIALFISTVLCFIPMLILGLFKLIPIPRSQLLCLKGVDQIVTLWCGINNYFISTALKIKLNLTGSEYLKPKEWYLVVANHQTWLDIVILQYTLNRKIPALKFFVKDQLKWVPLMGFAWWAMGCAFMKRHSKEWLAKNPHKKGKDLLATQKAVEGFKKKPVSIMTFVEGTRFTPEKKEQQNSPYQHLLKPKAGGISFIIGAMGQQITHLLDVTIIYPDKNPSLWDFLCRRIESVTVAIRSVPIPSQFTSDALITDEQTQAEFRTWLNNHWNEKDSFIASLK